ncbi:MAG: tRNA (adenosine(37)-N6)-threonylcarbamoyltransferase complex ATPase subunit type 1 TsaE [Alphaproteobacteria bacterium]|nr:tRNA (adenosine(37)-N6)-threonylcarbamoyltransferase complex ATPase subunit type 1 TsaE [Alphaproteobacteria bacterium]
MPTALDSLQATQQFAVRIAKKLKRTDVLLLKGDLGAGKTTLAQGIIRALSQQPVEVTSPTFTLLQTYPVMLADGECELWHYDLYRVEHPSELAELGMDEAFEHGISLIEWPERLGDALPPQHVTITLKLTGQGEGRLATVTATGDASGTWSSLHETSGS